ncbi:MAG: hypothetical protein PUB18_05335 [bacterium]|nr:hypothetical protein [bacterium]
MKKIIFIHIDKDFCMSKGGVMKQAWNTIHKLQKEVIVSGEILRYISLFQTKVSYAIFFYFFIVLLFMAFILNSD